MDNFLILVSGLAWTIVYLDSIRIGMKDKTFAMPFWALALNKMRPPHSKSFLSW